MTFNPEIVSVDTCRFYHSGPKYFVEVDIVLSPEMPLWKAHDISQDLQDQIEALPDVDRCFVHVDHEVDHKPVRQPRKATWSCADLSRSTGRRSRSCHQLKIYPVSLIIHTVSTSYTYKATTHRELQELQLTMHDHIDCLEQMHSELMQGITTWTPTTGPVRIIFSSSGTSFTRRTVRKALVL